MVAQRKRTTVLLVVVLLVVGGLGGVASAQQDTDTNETTTAADQANETATETEVEQGNETTPETAADEDNETTMRVLHVSPILPGIDVDSNDVAIGTNVTFSEATEYVVVDSGNNSIEARINESQRTVFEEQADLEPGMTYTVLAVAAPGDDEAVLFEPALLRDGFVLPSEENTSVRFVHASPDAPAVDVTVQESGTVLAQNLSYRNDSPYFTIPAGNYTLEIRETDPDAEGDVLATRNVSLEGGTVSTAIALGFAEPDDAPVDFPLAVALTTDAAGAADEPANETTPTESPS